MAKRTKVTFESKSGNPTFLRMDRYDDVFGAKPRVPISWLVIAFVFFSLGFFGLHESDISLGFMHDFMGTVNSHFDVTSMPSLFVYVGFHSQAVVTSVWDAFIMLCLGFGFTALILQWRDFAKYKSSMVFYNYFSKEGKK